MFFFFTSCSKVDENRGNLNISKNQRENAFHRRDRGSSRNLLHDLYPPFCSEHQSQTTKAQGRSLFCHLTLMFSMFREKKIVRQVSKRRHRSSRSDGRSDRGNNCLTFPEAFEFLQFPRTKDILGFSTYHIFEIELCQTLGALYFETRPTELSYDVLTKLQQFQT